MQCLNTDAAKLSVYIGSMTIRRSKKGKSTRTKLRIKCTQCGHWNRIEVEKVMLNPDSQKPQAKIYLPTYLLQKTEVCLKCKAVFAEKDEATRIIEGRAVRYGVKNIE